MLPCPTQLQLNFCSLTLLLWSPWRPVDAIDIYVGSVQGRKSEDRAIEASFYDLLGVKLLALAAQHAHPHPHSQQQLPWSRLHLPPPTWEQSRWAQWMHMVGLEPLSVIGLNMVIILILILSQSRRQWAELSQLTLNEELAKCLSRC